MAVQTHQKPVFLGYFMRHAFLGKMFQTKVVLLKIPDPAMYILCSLSLCVSLNKCQSCAYELKCENIVRFSMG